GRPADPGGAAVLASLARTSDPDAAALALVRLVDAQADTAALLDRLRTEPALRNRLLAVLGASSALADHLIAHPTDWWLLEENVEAPLPDPAVLAAELLTAVGADPDDPPWGSGGSRAAGTGEQVVDALRLAYRR